MNIDPLAENYYGWSPYNYSYNSPIVFTDPTGLGPIYDKDGNIIGYEVEDGQGPSQIAADLNSLDIFNVEVGYLDIVESNPEKFSNVENLDDPTDIEFKKLNLNEGESISISKVLKKEEAIQEQLSEIDKEISNIGTRISELNSEIQELNNQKGSNDKMEKSAKFQKEQGVFPGDPKLGHEIGNTLAEELYKMGNKKINEKIRNLNFELDGMIMELKRTQEKRGNILNDNKPK